MPERRDNENRSRNREGGRQALFETARERPIAAAAAVGAAAAAGVFLWSRRNQISDQLSNLSEQISDWTSNMQSGSSTGQGSDYEMAGAGSTNALGSTGTTGTTESGSARGRTSGSSRSTGSTGTTGMSETGGGNASLGAHSGGGDVNAGISGRSRA